MKEINESLTQEELYVLKDKGTERPFSGKFDTFFEDGVYKCKNCKAEFSDLNKLPDSMWKAMAERRKKK